MCSGVRRRIEGMADRIARHELAGFVAHLLPPLRGFVLLFHRRPHGGQQLGHWRDSIPFAYRRYYFVFVQYGPLSANIIPLCNIPI